MKIQAEKWYIEELKKKAKADKLQRIGINQKFIQRNKKANFSIYRFLRYIINQWRRVNAKR